MSDNCGYRTLLDYKKTPRLTGRGGVLGVFFVPKNCLDSSIARKLPLCYNSGV